MKLESKIIIYIDAMFLLPEFYSNKERTLSITVTLLHYSGGSGKCNKRKKKLSFKLWGKKR